MPISRNEKHLVRFARGHIRIKGEVNRTLEILEGAKDKSGCVPMALVRRALKKPDQRWISEQDMTDKLTRLINEFEMIMSDIREKEVDDSVCGLCEYDADHGMDGYANECPGFYKNDCFRLKDEYRKQWMSMNY